MARYIDADALKERLEDFSKWCKDGRKEGVDFVLDCPLPNTPTADVVPKSEYDRLEKLFKDMTQEAKGYLYRIYGIRADVAREIFEEIEKIATAEGAYDYVSIQEIAELKKKYTEGDK